MSFACWFIITLLKIHFIALCTDCMCCLKLSFLADAYSQWPQLNQRTLCTACMCCFRVSFLDWSQLNWYPLCTKIGCCNFWLAAATFGWLEPLLASCSHFWLAAVTFGWLQPLLAVWSHFWPAAVTFGWLQPILASWLGLWPSQQAKSGCQNVKVAVSTADAADVFLQPWDSHLNSFSLK